MSNPANLERFARFRRWIATALAVSLVGSFASLGIYELGLTEGTEREVTDGIVAYCRQSAVQKYHRLLTHYFTKQPK